MIQLGLHPPRAKEHDDLWEELTYCNGAGWLDAWACFAVLRDLEWLIFLASDRMRIVFDYSHSEEENDE